MSQTPEESQVPSEHAAKRSLLARWFDGKLWIPLVALAIFIIIAIVSFVLSLH